ncbi:HD domain-containing protein [Burkholderia pseudomallei]|uniref:HD domain-containing protein n=1 Tax=Burkholderia pseudomallei TaxID=28450 RepID=UPI00015F7C85|nr:HD domain-containing protein [Burkholderia pseudomallei]AJX61186.1 HD domain protein [Burkholderia pseudomallei Pasteur 52237]EDO95553.1 GTP pyrophosphokinase [Burkholderia pseudomallei Pasteur 52237]MWA22324.1 HD domain-containing protein [Burkholderia pseudomallei]VBQ80707.1 metal dependent phosphohydrolase [Burkholderia pseudomallei]
MNIVEKARIFATAAHAAVDQRRKYTDEPYINHPQEVAFIVETAGGTPEMLAAAWLHDVVEDTGVMIETIEQEFGAEVATMVAQLTDVSRPEHGNREERKRIDREHTAQAWPKTKTIKLADLISNSRSIAARDPKFAAVYLREKQQLLDVLRDGHPSLWREANSIVEKHLGEAA